MFHYNKQKLLTSFFKCLLEVRYFTANGKKNILRLCKEHIVKMRTIIENPYVLQSVDYTKCIIEKRVLVSMTKEKTNILVTTKCTK